MKNLRRDYAADTLRRSDLTPDPFSQFDVWFKEAATHAGILEVNAMDLATSGSDGQVTLRTVLLKGWNTDGFVFFTNYGSIKAQQIAQNPRVALLFAWLPLERQVSITGTATKIPREESAEYFLSRPLASRLGAWASHQSQPVASRKTLEDQFEAAQEQFESGDVPLPDFWGGYRVVPETIEFWQGRQSRLHDRFLYTRSSEGEWLLSRLSP